MKRALTNRHLKKTDPQMAGLIGKEERRQFDTIDLIASENFASPAVREASGSVLTNKYSEGYPGARYYPGNEVIDEVERLAGSRALALFGLSSEDWAVNVQPYSGSPANFEVYAALLRQEASEGQAQPVVLGMELAEGGHLTHGHKVSHSGKFFHFEQYGLDERGIIDYEEVERLAGQHKPRLIVCGCSAYSQIVDFERFGEIARSHGALLMADIAHIAGLVAARVHPSPFPHCDIVTTTTHKTLRGPRGAMIFTRLASPSSARRAQTKLSKKVDKSVFPGHQGGPHNNTTAAIAVALHEASLPAFGEYTRHIVRNAQTLAEELIKRNFTVVSGGTENHLMLIDLQNKSMTGGEAQERLEAVGITANRNAVPNDPRGPLDPSGIRLGTPAVTTRGMGEEEMRQIADFIDRALKAKNKKKLQEIKKEVRQLAIAFPPPGFES